jgi:hypothetical protein
MDYIHFLNMFVARFSSVLYGDESDVCLFLDGCLLGLLLTLQMEAQSPFYVFVNF